MIKDRINLSGSNIGKKYILIILTGFLVSRVILPGGVIPFGYGFFAASLEYSISSLITGIVVCLGALSTGFNARSLIVIISVLTLASFKILAGNTKKPVHRLVPFLLSGMAASVVVIIVNGFVWYDLIMGFLQNAVSVLGYFIFQGGLRAFSLKNGKFVLKEDISSIAITLILCVFGFPEINIFMLNLRNVIGIFLIIVFSYKGSYGLLARLGKWGTCAGVVILSASFTFMMGAPDNITGLLWDVIAADFLFFITPEKILDKLKLPGSSNINVVVDKANYSDEMTSMMVGRLEGYSQSYAVLAKSFAKFAKGVPPETNSKKILIERVGSRICEECDMTEYCWKRTKTETSKAFLDLCDSLERNGRIVWESVPEFFKEECEKTQGILTEIRIGYEVGRVEKIWAQKLAESKDVYAMQLGSLASAAHNLAMEMKNDIKLMVKMSESLEIEFKKSGYKGIKATVIQNRFGKYEVSLDFEKSDIMADGGILRIISGVLKRRMISGGESNKYIEANRFNVKTGVSCMAKNPRDVSGDSYTFINGGGGSFAAVLCDGMGTGKKARELSGLAVKMIENFSFNGFDNETAIEMINSALVMRAEDDSYSTLDLVSVNLQNGNVDVLKFGGMPTIIKYKLAEEDYSVGRQYLPNIESISSGSLPVGIMNRISGRTIKKKVSNGDCIVMMTDGVFDAYRQRGKSTGDLIRFIEMTECIAPHEFADRILKETLHVSSGHGQYKMAAGDFSGGTGTEKLAPPDDMTILVMMVEEE